MRPDRILVMDLSAVADPVDHCNKAVDLSRFPDGEVMHFKGLVPTSPVMHEFLDGMDVIFGAETFYDWNMLALANSKKIASVLQYNYEFCDHLLQPNLPQPTLFAAPSPWMYEKIKFRNKLALPVPIATDRFSPAIPPSSPTRFLHVVGRPAIHDRNGTIDLLKALRFIRSNITLTICCQRPSYVTDIMARHRINPPRNINLVLQGPKKNYWENYSDQHVAILPRRYGGLCLSLNEALGNHIPTVMPNISPNNQWLPKTWLTPATEKATLAARDLITVYQTHPQHIAGKIDNITTSSSWYREAHETAKKISEEYSWATLKDRYLLALQRAIDMV